MPATDLDDLRQQLGERYLIERQLGRGGMGAVYLARDRQLDRLLAVKVLPTEFATRRDLRDRFLRETRTAAGFSHPNIVPVFAVEERDDLIAMAMGYVEGESLAERVARAGPLTIRDTVRLLDDVGYALAYAHGRGVVHRDIKPDNIMLERATGRALVMDFGIARAMHSESAVADGLTRVGEVVGTPEYMSPEQASGDRVDGRSDLYSLGLVAWFALTGTPAVSGTSTQQVLVKQLTETLPPIVSVRSDVPDSLSDAIAQCLHKNPDDRFTSAEAFVEAVEMARQGEPEVPIPVRNFAQELSSLGTAVLLCVGAMVVLWLVVVRLFGWHPFDALTQMAVVAAALCSRSWGTWRATQRLMKFGFEPREVASGLRALMDERAAGRAMLRADAAYVRRQRIIRLSAVLPIVASFVIAKIAADMRTQIGPNAWYLPPMAYVLFMLRSVLLGAGVIALLRSPLRMPISERLFRWIWLGPVGRWFFARAASGEAVTGTVPRGSGRMKISRLTSASTSPHAARARQPGSARTALENNGRSDGAVVSSDATREIASLAERVSRLERWRASVRTENDQGAP